MHLESPSLPTADVQTPNISRACSQPPRPWNALGFVVGPFITLAPA